MDRRIIEEDLDQVLALTADLWSEMRGKKIFISGGTGFFGKCFLESFEKANDVLGLKAKAVVLSRNPSQFTSAYPQMAKHPSIELVLGDVRDFNIPDSPFDYMIHAATDPSGAFNENSPLEMFETIVAGTRRMLDFAVRSGVQKILYISSGAVYGKQTLNRTHMSEEDTGSLDPLDKGSAYGEGKRAAELLCGIYSRKFGVEVKIARCFAFVGPYLPLDRSFAIGHFIRSVLEGKKIEIHGDGTPYRSYLYTSDLMVWLWTLLFKGQAGRAYNIGSEHAINIKELAEVVMRTCNSNVGISIAREPIVGQPTVRYVPSVRRATEELGLSQSVGLEQAIRRTKEFHSLNK